MLEAAIWYSARLANPRERTAQSAATAGDQYGANVMERASCKSSLIRMPNSRSSAFIHLDSVDETLWPFPPARHLQKRIIRHMSSSEAGDCANQRSRSGRGESNIVDA